MREPIQALILETIKQPHSFSLTHSLYNHQVTLINQLLQNQASFGVAHLTSKQLLALLEESIFPLEQRHDYLHNQENEEATRTTLKANQEKLKQLKQIIYQRLLALCQNRTAKDPTLKGALDDDSRLLIYDILADAGFDQATLYSAIINGIPKRSYQKMRDASVVNKRVTEIYQFTHQVCEALCIQKQKPGRMQTFWQDSTQKAQALIAALGLQIPLMWQWRYLLYFLLSFCAYYLLMQAITVVSVLLLSEKVLTLMSSVLFYAIGLLPLWGFISQHVYHGIHGFISRWRAPKQAQIVETLFFLEQTQQFIGYRLNQVIVDISHYDFDDLKQIIQQKKAAISELQTQLSHLGIFETLLVGEPIKKQAKTIHDRLEVLEKDLASALQEIIAHIMLRVQEERMLLEASLLKQDLVPSFPLNQFKKISGFLQEFATKEQMNDFLKQSHITHLWLQSLPQLTFANIEPKGILQQPFGKHLLRHDVIKGWQILLTAWFDDSEKSTSALLLNDLLGGKKFLTQAALSQAVNKVADNDEQAKNLLLTIQSILFHTLSERPSAIAGLLSQLQKDQIIRWHHAHQSLYQKARDVLKAAFSDNTANVLAQYSNVQLVQFFQVLEGRSLYKVAKGHRFCKWIHQSQLRQYFDRYRGQSSKAFMLLRFIPEPMKTCMLVEVATKRLAWIVSHLGKGVDPKKPFDAQDIELFLHHDLSKQHQRFNVRQALQNSSEWTKPYTQKMAEFLQSCRRHGLDTGQLFIDYQKQKQAVSCKPLLLLQFKKSIGKIVPFNPQSSQSEIIRVSYKIVV